MEMNYKRKLDCIVDSMDVIVPEAPHLGFFEGKDQGSKKLKISVNARVEPYLGLEALNAGYQDSEAYRTSFSCDGMITEDDIKPNRVSFVGDPSDYCDDTEDRDIPTTSEVIHSLRKVMLWMSAQEDNNTDHIQYLTNVERYALSKQDTYVQQRKITEYFKHD